MDGWEWLIVAIKCVVILLIFLGAPLILVLVERWTLGRLQSRIGPNRVGWSGTLQTAADGLKLGIKEDLIPRGADKIVFWFGPVFLVVPALAAWAIVPVGPKVRPGRAIRLWAVDLNVALPCFLAMGYRVPFDLPEAESEIVAGFHVEYSGMRFAMFFIAEYANIILISAIITTLYLGGWLGWTIPGMEGLTGIVWFALKTVAFIAMFLLLRAALPRLRYDQLMSFCWKFLMPLGIINVLLAAGLRMAWS